MKTFICTLLLIRLGFASLSEGAVMDLDPVQVGINGVTRSVIVQGQYAYCEIVDSTGTGGGLRVFDVSNPTNPVPVAFYEAGVEVNGLAVVGSHAYLGVAGSLHVIDISHPTSPRLAGRYDGGFGILSLAVVGNYAYLAGYVLQIVDVSDPANPSLIGTYQNAPSPTISDVSVAGHYAYVAWYGGLDVVDVNNPASPQRVSSYPVHAATDVFVFGDHAYVGSAYYPGSQQILDMSNPANPQFVRYTPVRRFVVSGNRGYTGDYGGGLSVLDLSDPGDPQLIGHYGGMEAVSCISGNYGYQGAGTAGLQVVDLSNFVPPPEWVGRFERADEVAFPRSAFVQGSTVYLGNGDGWFDVLDVSNPANPQRWGRTNALDSINNIFVSGNRAYLAASLGLTIMDVSDPPNPWRIVRYAIAGATGGGAFDVCVSGDHAFVAGSTGFQVLNVSNPAVPQKVWEDQNVVAFRVIVSSNYAYVVSSLSGTKGLHVFDVSNPANPQKVGSYVAHFDPADLFVVGNRAYLLGHGYGLEILDVSNPSNLQKLGHVPVDAARVFISGNRAYISGTTLQVVDVSNPAQPLFLGTYDALGPVAGVSGSYACVPYPYGLQILDLNAPPHNEKLPAGGYAPYSGGGSANVVISGNLAYVSGWSGQLDVVDISDPTNLIRAAAYNFGNYAVSLVSGNYGFLTDQTDVLILDISDPTNLHPVGNFSTDSVVWGLAVSNHHAHVATEQDGVQVFDVSNPASPQWVTRYSTNGAIWGLFISGNLSFLWCEAGAEIFDVSNPANPQRVSILSTNPFINGVCVSSNYAYVSASDGLEIFDVSNPANPQKVGGHAGGFGQIIVVVGRAYASDKIYDVSDPTQPRQIGIFHSNGGLLGGISGDYAFLVSSSSGNLEVVNVGRLANPQRFGAYAGLSASAVRGGVSVSGDHAFVADGTNGLQVLDVGNPVAPQRVGGYDTPGSAEDVFVAGHHAFVADWYGGLRVIGVSNPANPQFVASLALPDYDVSFPEVAERVVVSGNFAYVTGYALHVIDVSNPVQPVRVGGYRPPGGAVSIFVVGHYAYVGGLGLHVIDVRDPANPQRVGGVGDHLFPPQFYDVLVSGGFAYVAAGNSGLMVFDVSDPANPRQIGIYEINNALGGEDARSVQVVGRYAHVMDRIFGVYVLDVGDPTHPRRVGGNPNVGDLSAFAMDLTVAGNKVYTLAGEQGLVILDQFRDPNALRLEALPPLTSGSFRFLLHGPSGMSGQIQRSANLRDWTDWQPFALGPVPQQVIDSSVGPTGSRFYRAVSP